MSRRQSFTAPLPSFWLLHSFWSFPVLSPHPHNFFCYFNTSAFWLSITQSKDIFSLFALNNL